MQKFVRRFIVAGALGFALFTFQPNLASADDVTVNSGDTLWGISQDYNIDVSDLKSLNNLSSTNIQPGQTLITSETSETAEILAESEQASYTVQSGDTLWGISQKHQMSVDEIKSMNDLSGNSIQIGQTLSITQSSSRDADINTNQDTGFVDSLISEAKSHLGTPYVWGSMSPGAFDSSGFIVYTFQQNGVSLERTHTDYYHQGETVNHRQIGDVVFFETYKNGPSHAGIYLGNNEFIHSSSSQGVIITKMDNPYWEPRYIGTKRFR
ncbi:C40 family peptidase [Texcoconibacillus texcoconensis]|uniref:Cell wall-associated NlpC family hydrolase n=1 Tax=Texcoconibacillus texcoconensis TaxID=1095777 RepID=A0A840QTI6_9BACI|nr:C40 family peptidase [Texcoconibacillus texcoconensis]MBB5174601.1 cell wall-associated NlpC family hydrolase [Texcoconibacillus texcoconensis]